MELKHEWERRSGLDTRSAAVITTSGSFVTLAFALGALLTNVEGFKPSMLTVALLVMALGAFVAAAVLALLANRLIAYRIVTVKQLHNWRGDRCWLDEKDNARWLLADANTKTIGSLRTGNNKKPGYLDKALWAQISAFGLLTAAVLVVLLESL